MRVAIPALKAPRNLSKYAPLDCGVIQPVAVEEFGMPRSQEILPHDAEFERLAPTPTDSGIYTRIAWNAGAAQRSDMGQAGVRLHTGRQIKRGANLKLSSRTLAWCLFYGGILAAGVPLNNHPEHRVTGADPPALRDTPVQEGFTAVVTRVRQVVVHQRENEMGRPRIGRVVGCLGHDGLSLTIEAQKRRYIQRQTGIELCAIAGFEVDEPLGIEVGRIAQKLQPSKGYARNQQEPE